MFFAHYAFFFNNFHQSILHMASHIFHIAAYIEMSAFFKPLINFRCFFKQSVLNINLFITITRKSDIHIGQCSCFQKIMPFCLVQKFCFEVSVSKKKPAFSGLVSQFAMLNKSAIRSNARSGTNHDYRCFIIFGQSESRIRFNKYRNFFIFNSYFR